jgi:hypothetical protein
VIKPPLANPKIAEKPTKLANTAVKKNMGLGSKTNKIAPRLKLSKKDIEQQRKSFALLSQMQSIPLATKAVIKAKSKALENPDAKPLWGSSPEIELQYLDSEQDTVKTQLSHLGNNQYMNTVTVRSGMQIVQLGELTFSQQIAPMFNGKKAVLLIDAVDSNNPIFNLYPVVKQTN